MPEPIIPWGQPDPDGVMRSLYDEAKEIADVVGPHLVGYRLQAVNLCLAGMLSLGLEGDEPMRGYVLDILRYATGRKDAQ